MTFKFWVWIIVQLLLTILKLPLIGLFRIWRPSWVFDPSLFSESTVPPGPVNVQAYAMSGDGPKFIGLLYAATMSDDHWAELKKFWRVGTFARYQDPAMDAGSDNLSGDQLAGMLYGIWQRHLHTGLTAQEYSQLRDIWINTLLGTPILTFKHPTKTTRPDRGYLLGWMSFGCDLIQTLAFLEFGADVLKLTQCGLIAKQLRFWLRPMLMCVDTAFALGRVYAAAWYDEHSTMLLCCLTTMGQAPMKFLRDRYPANPDIQGLFYRHELAHPLEATESLERARMFLDDYTLDGRAVPSDWMQSYFSLRQLIEFKWPMKTMSKFILPSQYRSGRYLWEQNDVQPDQSVKTGQTLDYHFLKSLVE
jgi:hypothetical protein